MVICYYSPGLLVCVLSCLTLPCVDEAPSDPCQDARGGGRDDGGGAAAADVRAYLLLAPDKNKINTM